MRLSHLVCRISGSQCCSTEQIHFRRSRERGRPGRPEPIQFYYGYQDVKEQSGTCNGGRPLKEAGRSGVSRIRTGDPLLAKQVLYQLSYYPAAMAGLTRQGTPSPSWG